MIGRASGDNPIVKQQGCPPSRRDPSRLTLSISRVRFRHAGCMDLLGVLFTFWSRKIIENTKQIAVEIRDRKLMQSPRLRFWMRNDLRLAATPQVVQLIYFFFAVQIEPDQHGPGIAELLSKSAIGQEHPAMPFRNSCNPAVFATPVYAEAKIALVICRSHVDIPYGYFRYRTRKLRFHCDSYSLAPNIAVQWRGGDSAGSE